MAAADARHRGASYTGRVQGDQGQPEAHTVTFTVTDVTKVVQGVRTVAVWDVDLNQLPTGLVQESELSLWAQDDAGNVWNMGEYPEEYAPPGRSRGAEHVAGGPTSAQPGIHMAPDPMVTSKWTSQGYAPTIDFEDCARVNKLNQTICASRWPADHLHDLQRRADTEEKDAFDPASGFQTKMHAPGLGIVKIGATTTRSARRSTSEHRTRSARTSSSDVRLPRSDARPARLHVRRARTRTRHRPRPRRRRSSSRRSCSRRCSSRSSSRSGPTRRRTTPHR